MSSLLCRITIDTPTNRKYIPQVRHALPCRLRPCALTRTSWFACVCVGQVRELDPDARVCGLHPAMDPGSAESATVCCCLSSHCRSVAADPSSVQNGGLYVFRTENNVTQIKLAS